MKKILALTVAVAMLASMAVTAVAAPHETEAAIEFVIPGLSDLPVPSGPFCPVEDSPNGDGDWGSDDEDDSNFSNFAFIGKFGSNNVDFGEHPIPPLGNIRFYALDAVDNNDDLLDRHVRVLGMGVQAYLEMLTPTIEMVVPGTWVLTSHLYWFYDTAVGGNRTLDGFDMELILDTVNDDEAGYISYAPEAFPTGFVFGDNVNVPGVLPVPTNDDWYVHQLEDSNNNVLEQSDTGLLAVVREAATGRTGGVFAWEWHAILCGEHVAGNITPVPAQADIFWEYTMTVDP